jgi:hypothetical protein
VLWFIYGAQFLASVSCHTAEIDEGDNKIRSKACMKKVGF